jgi:hypothetical protein
MRFWVNKAVYILISLLLVIPPTTPVFASALADDGLQVSGGDIRRLERVLRRNSIPVDAPNSEQMEKLFRARSAAHRLRLSQIYLDVVKDPEFLIKFPEFKPLVADSKRTVEALLEHDASKGSAEAAKAIKVLSLTQGINIRNPPKGFNEKDTKLVTETMKEAIHDLNFVDGAKMEAKYKALSPNQVWAHLHESLTETMDFYDTFKSRQAELAKNGEPLLSPSKWLEKLEGEGSLSAEQKKDNVLKKRLAVYLETKDPLKNPQNFAKADDFMNLPTKEFKPLLEKTFQERGKSLLAAANTSSGKGLRKLAAVGKPLVKGTGIGFAATGAVDYLVDPEKANLTDAIAGSNILTTPIATADCDSVACEDFFKSCRTELNVEKATQAQLLAHKNFSMCLDTFFLKPLDRQAEKRQDATFDNFMSQFSPAVRNLSCTPDSNVVKVEMISEKKIHSQKLVFDSSGSVERVLRDDPDLKLQDNLVFNNSKAQLLQRCDESKKCLSSYEMKTVQDTSLYFWRDDRYVGKVPIDSFKWAKKSSQLAEHQGTSIYKCCQNKMCQQFFIDRVSNFNRAKERHRQQVEEQKLQAGTR